MCGWEAKGRKEEKGEEPNRERLGNFPFALFVRLECFILGCGWNEKLCLASCVATWEKCIVTVIGIHSFHSHRFRREDLHTRPNNVFDWHNRFTLSNPNQRDKAPPIKKGEDKEKTMTASQLPVLLPTCAVSGNRQRLFSATKDIKNMLS